MWIKSEKCIGGGRCEECGRCSRYDTTNRKTKLIYLPDSFRPQAEEAEDGREKYGIAFDIGTTTVVGMLWGLSKAKLVDVIALTNPQSAYGADVISRITYSMNGPEHLKLLTDKVRDCLNEIIRQITLRHSIDPQDITKAVTVGNTTMSHLFLGVDPSSLARSPFNPAFSGPVEKTAGELGLLMNPSSAIDLLPNIAGHVGSDIVGVLLASEIKKLSGLRLAIDIGTNGEIILAHDGRILVCSTAAGPAFEGARIRQGMRAASGSIEHVRIENGDVRIRVIDNAEPIGICGSGLIDAVAQMLDAGLINFKGNILSTEDAAARGMSPELVSRLRKGEEGNEFVLAWKDDGGDISITQKDIREVQLAKGAIYGGIAILIQCMGADSSQLEEIMLAGAFGSYLNKRSILRIGMVPDVGEDKIKHIGNAAGVGACMALLSAEEKEKAAMQSKEAEHIELAGHPDFEREYVSAMFFPRQSGNA
ncbi:MAG TPA: ASKHA domain-containing protein [Anaerovoracaceae bacterium]|nr:ASKHA domain-containing protein [Anaerovoracaceae bacterium]